MSMELEYDMALFHSIICTRKRKSRNWNDSFVEKKNSCCHMTKGVPAVHLKELQQEGNRGPSPLLHLGGRGEATAAAGEGSPFFFVMHLQCEKVVLLRRFFFDYLIRWKLCFIRRRRAFLCCWWVFSQKVVRRFWLVFVRKEVEDLESGQKGLTKGQRPKAKHGTPWQRARLAWVVRGL